MEGANGNRGHRHYLFHCRRVEVQNCLKNNIMGFKLPELNFSYDALEPSIDAKTMEIHHSKHHNGYTNNLNNAIKGTDLDSSTIESILAHLDMGNKGLRNNAGGYYNHKLFWEVISPVDNGNISDTMLNLINTSHRCSPLSRPSRTSRPPPRRR
jgi:hypothetical protein